MKRRWGKVTAIFLTILMAAGLSACGASKQQTKGEKEETEVQKRAELTVLAAASMTDAMQEIGEAYQKEHPDISFIYQFDSSGTLQTQIEEGAVCDLFISAGQKQMDGLGDLVKSDSRVDLLENTVVLVAPKGAENAPASFEDLANVSSIALGNSDVPVGQYSREIFDNLGITDEVNKMEINEGKNVTDVLASVSEGSNEVGIVYATDAASVADSVEVIAEAPEESLKTPVLYPAGMVEDKEASDDDKAAAEAFLEYLQSDEALEVFEKYGFAAYVNDEKTDDMAAAEETAEPTEEASEDTAE